MEIPVRQRQYQFHKGPQGYDLRLIDDVTVRAPGPHEVLVRVMASSLNRRDLLIHRGLYPIGDRDAVVPLSDGAGEVVAIGSSVTRVNCGDRVVASFFQAWLDGRPVASTGASALGGALDGMLTEYITLHETGVLQCPSHLSFEEAATLPCAALTAWNGLFTCGGLRRGDYALLQGTGGVSIFGLQFAALAGATVLLTSSSDGKLARARRLGATHLINYRTTPDWDRAALEATAGIGVHHVLEVGGIGTLQRSLAALAHGGHIAIIGGLAGFGGEIPSLPMIGHSTRVSGIFVGSRADFVQMNTFIEQHVLRPVIDRVFDYTAAPAAFEHMEAGDHFGKVVIRHG
jgi:NADPH:quinone reductase-like Zn-dependent oxidoreductase